MGTKKKDKNHKLPHCGFLTDKDIDLLLDNEIVIHPYSEKNLTPVGYNLSFSKFIYSLTTHTFVNIIDNGKDPAHFLIKPNETVLILTKETIWVSRNIGGTFHSKVSMVTQGLTHVSTTLDPGWQGQLLVPITNSTRQKHKIDIMNMNGEYLTFITLVLHRSENTSCIGNDNQSARLDLLKRIVRQGGSSHERNKIIKLLDKIEKSIYNHPDIIGNKKLKHDLNNCKNKEDEIDKFKKDYNNFDKDKILEYQAELLIHNKSLIKRNRIKLLLITILAVMFVAALYYFGFTIKEWYGSAFINLATALISIIGTALVTNRLKFM